MSVPVRLLDDDEVVLRRTGVRFPIELRPPAFCADEPQSWPRVEGRLEYLEGKLFFMPPCGETQQEVAGDVVFILRSWSENHQDFFVGANEAGMKLGTDIRAADAAVWRRADVASVGTGLRHVAPILAIEVAGQDEEEPVLREKSRWYLDHGVALVWLVLPASREVVLCTVTGESRHAVGARLPDDSRVPDLAPDVSQFFAQIDRR
jgi:Uma2 family endonuclease